MRPVNNALMKMDEGSSDPQIRELIVRWARLHAVRTALGLAATLVILLDVLTPIG
jgi:hypothetical protein